MGGKNKLSKRQLASISFIKSAIFSYKYFGFKGMLHLYVLCSRHIKFYKLKGMIKILGKPYMGCIRIGLPEVSIFDEKYERVVWENYGNIEIKLPFIMGNGCKISNRGDIYFGKNFHITANSSIICNKKIVFGDDVLISWDVLIMDSDLHKIMASNNLIKNPPREIIIGNHCWISCRSTILKGCHLPDDTIIAANTTTSKTFKKCNTIIGSNKIISENIWWKE